MGTAPCAATPVTPGIVTFDPQAFVTAFPRFATPSPGYTSGADGTWFAALTNTFALACLQLNNSCCSVVKDAPTRALLLNLLIAHIAMLTLGVDGLPPSGVVGRINSAQQGSVSVQSELDTKTFSEAYYAQTPFGVQFWQSTARFRSARYVTRGFGAFGGGGWDAWPQ